jgi:hypothetical protein
MSDRVYRAPMRARGRDDVPAGMGARRGIAAGFVGVGVGEATEDERAARRLRLFASLPIGTSVWTRTLDGTFRLGRIRGPLAVADPETRSATGLQHVRTAEWRPERFTLLTVPPAVAATFARGGRNLQRIHDADAERESAAWWPDEPDREGLAEARWAPHASAPAGMRRTGAAEAALPARHRG